MGNIKAAIGRFLIDCMKTAEVHDARPAPERNVMKPIGELPPELQTDIAEVTGSSEILAEWVYGATK